MPAPPLPAGEERRLAVLHDYDVLDAEPNPDLDEIALLASIICETPIALVSLVDRDRQRFTANIGLTIGSTRRDDAFCAYAILDPDRVTVVPDAVRDRRFAGNPLVTGDPHVRFYAGAPLVTPEGAPLGTLCVIDRKPRVLTPDQEQALRVLSRQVMAQLELRRHVAALERRVDASERYKRVLEVHRERLEAEVRHSEEQSLTDTLTGIPNRRALEARLATLDGSDSVMSVAMVDLDGFKRINDEHGHRRGDEVLAHVAAVLAAEARIRDLVGRYGGDEFLVILPDTGPDGAAAVAERMRRAVELAFGHGTAGTLSIGVASGHAGSGTRRLVDEADRALYRAKAEGRNRVRATVDVGSDGLQFAEVGA